MIRPGTPAVAAAAQALARALVLVLVLVVAGCANRRSTEASPSPSASGAGSSVAAAAAPVPAGGRIKLCTDHLHKPGDHWKEDCNVCRCAADGDVTCSRFPCGDGAAAP